MEGMPLLPPIQGLPANRKAPCTFPFPRRFVSGNIDPCRHDLTGVFATKHGPISYHQSQPMVAPCLGCFHAPSVSYCPTSRLPSINHLEHEPVLSHYGSSSVRCHQPGGSPLMSVSCACAGITSYKISVASKWVSCTPLRVQASC